MSDAGDFDLEQFKITYFEECVELLADAETRLNNVQQSIGNVDVEDLHAIFRAVHSVKGGGGAFNFTQLVNFAHIYETLLDLMREGHVAVTDEVVSLMLSATDVLNNLVNAAREGHDLPEEAWADIAVELEALSGVTPSEDGDDEDHGGDDEPEGDDGAESGLKQFEVLLKPDVHLLQYANEPLLLIRELSSLGELETEIDLSKLPTLDKLKPDEIYLSWRFVLTTEKGEADIREVFEFVEDDCEITVTLLKADDVEQEISDAPVSDEASDESVAQAPAAVPDKPAGVPEKAKPAQAPATAAAAAPAGGAATASAKISSIRVDLERVDRLVNMVGELVITQAMLHQQSADLPAEFSQIMARGFEDLGMHTRELQESVMAIRMQPVKSVFARMPRLVREVSTKLGKKVDLVTSGENTEVDKTVIELLADPLTHMIRNSLDHGIETPSERAQTDKPERAKIHLSAEHRSGRILIDVADDGRGINRDRVYAKAVENGVIQADTNLTPEQIDELIFMPGFSTAEAVTDLSGRGVGMDVVRRNVTNLGGRISVTSQPGQGSRFTMSLPLTLAVLDGMITAVGTEKFVIPLTSIVESIRPTRDSLKHLSTGAQVVSVRGDYIPIVHLHRVFGLKTDITDPCKGLVVLVEVEGGQHVGIMVDELLGQQQVVIKSLETNYDPVAGVSAATILGNGRVALILDLDGLYSMGTEARNLPPLELEDASVMTTEQV
ncbi:chemotaxis protein CheA [Aestuariispira insulae]|uniref:Chemotaxis protein CheA n=1 Tax=Aestuariispira insulae TaxID=1461337 RepID=A0A3D9HXD4_9PROT|nr:chemotaxis protein CheA [Aestuariispira insulae]RED54075.1 two-component system chemotaxis sensor kinase CheA [Aestuariispira insulae]